ncbi:MAG: hypothetical protein MK135_04005 [Polyangiaceae bacterium]|nr:hypothetical protein [Polyangiaceae bacterium]
MLPSFIIDQIRQREENRSRIERPVLQLPLDESGTDGAGVHRPGVGPHPGEAPQDERQEVERGVAIYQL